MNLYFIVAGLLSAGVFLLHLFGGEYTLRRIPVEAFPTVPNGGSAIARQEVRVSWHLGRVDFLLTALVLFTLVFTDFFAAPDDIARLLAVFLLGYAAVVAIVPAVALHTPRALLNIPQWIVITLIALIILGGTR